MTRSFAADAGDGSQPADAEGDDPADTGAAAEAPVEGEHSDAGRDTSPGQTTLDAFADSARRDGGAFDVRAEIERIDRDIERVAEAVETLSDAVTRALDAETDGDDDDAAGGDERIDTPDDRRAHRGYE